MKIKEWGLTAYGIFSLFWPWVSVKPYVKDDYDQELLTNKHLAARPKEYIDQQRREYEPQVRERLHTFRWGFWGSFLFLVTAVVVAVLITAFVGIAPPRAKIWLGGASIFCFAWATLARLGRSALSMGGRTVLERIDLRIFWLLYWIGTLLGTLALI